MDLTAVAGAYEGVKAVKTLLGLAIEAKVDAEAKSKIIDAQAKLGQIQDDLFVLREQLFLLQEERNSLKQKLDESQAWNDQISNYELQQTPGGAVVYKSKKEPTHYACPSCINKREIHVLQTNRTLSGKYRCTGCGNEFPVEPRQEPPRAEAIPIQTPWG